MGGKSKSGALPVSDGSDNATLSAQAAAGVTVIIAARNAQATIERAVRSALAQPQAHQVIVIDDASSDDTATVALRCDPSASRLQVHRLPENLGPAGARNYGLEHAREDFITVLDADDFMLPGRLAELLSGMEGLDLLADDLCMSEEARPLALQGRLLDLAPGYRQRLTLGQFAQGNVSRPGRAGREMGFLKPLIRRSFLEAVGLRYDPSLRLGEDYVFYASALARGAQAQLISAAGYVAVRHRGSLSSQHSPEAVRKFYDACSALVAQLPAEDNQRAALVRQRDSVRRRVTHLDVLERRKAAGGAAAIALLFERAADAPYVLMQILRDKLASARSRRR